VDAHKKQRRNFNAGSSHGGRSDGDGAFFEDDDTRRLKGHECVLENGPLLLCDPLFYIIEV
jgi:hypothetical protein